MRILTVCLGNICRSPTAEAAIRQAADEMGVTVEVDSAGTGGWHRGAAPDDRMVDAAAREGLYVAGEARTVTPADFADFDLILAMDQVTLDELVGLAPPDAPARIRLFRDTDPEGPGDVPDPYYGGEAGFRLVVTMCRRTARSLVAALE